MNVIDTTKETTSQLVERLTADGRRSLGANRRPGELMDLAYPIVRDALSVGDRITTAELQDAIEAEYGAPSQPAGCLQSLVKVGVLTMEYVNSSHCVFTKIRDMHHSYAEQVRWSRRNGCYVGHREFREMATAQRENVKDGRPTKVIPYPLSDDNPDPHAAQPAPTPLEAAVAEVVKKEEKAVEAARVVTEAIKEKRDFSSTVRRMVLSDLSDDELVNELRERLLARRF